MGASSRMVTACAGLAGTCTSRGFRLSGRVALVVSLLGLAACGEEDRTETSFTPSNEKNALVSDDRPPELLSMVAPASAARVPPSAGPTLPVSLLPTEDFTLNGLAAIAASGSGSSVTTRIDGGEAGFTYGGAIRLGTCATGGPRVTSLIPITVDSLGSGSSYSPLSFPLDSLRAAPFTISYEVGGRAYACGAISAGTRGETAF